MARDDYETFALVREERCIEVSYQANWMNSGQWRPELRSEDILPVASSG